MKFIPLFILFFIFSLSLAKRSFTTFRPSFNPSNSFTTFRPSFNTFSPSQPYQFNSNSFNYRSSTSSPKLSFSSFLVPGGDHSMPIIGDFYKYDSNW